MGSGHPGQHHDSHLLLLLRRHFPLEGDSHRGAWMEFGGLRPVSSGVFVAECVSLHGCYWWDDRRQTRHPHHGQLFCFQHGGWDIPHLVWGHGLLQWRRLRLRLHELVSVRLEPVVEDDVAGLPSVWVGSRNLDRDHQQGDRKVVPRPGGGPGPRSQPCAGTCRFDDGPGGVSACPQTGLDLRSLAVLYPDGYRNARLDRLHLCGCSIRPSARCGGIGRG